jgi:integrase
VKLLEKVVEEDRPYTAHHLVAYLSKLFNWAIVRDVYGLNASPITRGIGKDIIGAKKPRQRVLSDAELREIWNATEATPYPFGPFVRMLLVTGQRLREVANAKWSEFDLDNSLWTIPAGRMKGDAAHEVPLSALALEILRSLPRDEKKRRDPNAYVFSTMGGNAPISGFSKAKIALDRLLAERRAKAAAAAGDELAVLLGWVFHDLRRTVRTNLSGLPVPDLVAELVIAHAKPGLHKVYDQHAYRDEKKRALDLWAAKLLSIVEGTNGGNVVHLSAAKG